MCVADLVDATVCFNNSIVLEVVDVLDVEVVGVDLTVAVNVVIVLNVVDIVDVSVYVLVIVVVNLMHCLS